MLQAPGPRGSPHIPHGDVAAGRAAFDDGLGVLTANVDSCFSSAVLAQVGHEGLCPWRVRYSK